MSTPTLCLDLLILLAGVSPAGFATALGVAVKPSGVSRMGPFPLLLTAGIYPVMAGAALMVHPELWFYHSPAAGFYLLALAAAPVGLALECFCQGLAVYRQTGQLPKGLGLHHSWGSNPLPFSRVALITAIGAGQELVYRQLWFAILAGSLGLPPVLVIIITSIIFGLDHSYWGASTVAVKSVSGVLYGCLYWWSGCAILVPLLTHLLQNWLLIALAWRRDG